MIERHSLLLYFVLTFAVFWGCFSLRAIDLRFGFWAPILGALAPGVVALAVTGVREGEAGVRALVRRLGEWRLGLRWYLVVLMLPVAQGLLALGVASAFGSFSAARLRGLPLGALIPTTWVIFLFAACEELGWRGYALPRLLARRNAVVASLILGCLHAVWHWPLAGQWSSSSVFAGRLLRGSTFVVAEAILLTWIFRNTRGSLLMTTLYHGMSNAAMLLYQGVDQARMAWLRPSISVATALVVVFSTGLELMPKRATQREAT